MAFRRAGWFRPSPRPRDSRFAFSGRGRFSGLQDDSRRRGNQAAPKFWPSPATIPPEIRSKILASGADDYLGKPLDYHQTLEKIGRLLGVKIERQARKTA